MSHTTARRHASLLAAALATIASASLSLAAPPKPPSPQEFNQNIRTTAALAPEDEIQTFHLPPGFEIQLVAADPEIDKPLNLAFDAAGRMWVTQTREYPFPAKPGDKARDAIKIIDLDFETGKAKKITTFADGLNIPMGVYPYKDGCIGFSIPNIYFFHDTQGTGHSDKKDLLLGPFSYDRDTHGLTNHFTRGFDGWLYNCYGFNNISTIKASDGSTAHMDSGHTYRMTLDGSHIDVWSSGMPNPWGIAFDPLGNMYVSDCSSVPIAQVQRGGYYPHFGRPTDGMGEAPAMMSHLHGSTAIAGMVYYADSTWPQEYWGNTFVGNPVTCRINRDKLEDHGSTRLAREMPDFLACDDPWFRPTDLQLGPDGALYCLDFYNRIIGHYEVALNHPGRDRERGRIWRIVYRGPDGKAKPAVAPDLSKATVDALIAALASPNITIRMLAMNQLTDRIGAAAVDPIKAAIGTKFEPVPSSAAAQPTVLEYPLTNQKVHGLWVLKRLDALDDAMLTKAAQDPERAVRAHLMRILAETPKLTKVQHDIAIAALDDRDAFVKRGAADALARHADLSNLRPLLDLRAKVPNDDTHLLFGVRSALRDTLSPAGNLAQPVLDSLSEADVKFIANVCPAIPTADSATFLVKNLSKLQGDNNYLRQIARYGSPADLDALAKFGRGRDNGDLNQELAIFKAIQEGFAQRGGPMTDSLRAWGGEIAGKVLDRNVDPKNKGQVQEQTSAIDMAKSLKLDAAQPQVKKILEDKRAAFESRGAAARALMALNAQANSEAVSQRLADAAEPAPLREQLAQALVEFNTPASRNAVLESLKVAPYPVQTKLALPMAGNKECAELLLENITAGKLSARLLQERPIRDRLNAARIPDLDTRVATLTKGLAPVDQQIQKVLEQHRAAYNPKTALPELGAPVFAKNCAACHSLDAKGAQVGPPLDGIGARGLDRIVEDVLDPNANVDPAFHYSIITLKDSTLVTGLLKREEGEQLVFVDSTAKEIKVAKKDIKEREESKSSLMPSNFAEVIPAEDFNNLIAFLLSKSVKPAK